MIWFGKSFIKFCKSFINLIKLVSTRTCSSARVRNYDDEMSALLIIVAKNWPKIMLKIGFWQKFNFELWQSLLWQSSTLGLSLAVPSSISYLDPHFCRRRRRRLPGTTQFPIRTLTQHKSGKLMLLASSIACAVTVLLRAKLRSVLQFWKSLHPHSILLFLVNLWRFSPFEWGTTLWWGPSSCRSRGAGRCAFAFVQRHFGWCSRQTALAGGRRVGAAQKFLRHSALTATVVPIVGPALLSGCIDIHGNKSPTCIKLYI